MHPIESAIESARRSTHFRQRVGCAITDSEGRIISTGHNKRETHPLQMRYARKINPDRCFLHAEIDALAKCQGTPHILYVARLTKNGQTALARPCPICHPAIVAAGVKRVVYTTNSGIESIDIR